MCNVRVISLMHYPPICQDMRQWRGGERKRERGHVRGRIYPLKTDSRDVHYPTDEPNPTHVKGLGREKAHLDFVKPALKIGAKIVPPRMPREMSECLDLP